MGSRAEGIASQSSGGWIETGMPMSRTRSSTVFERDLETLDAALAESLWSAAADSATPFDLHAARAIDLVDSFLALAEQARMHRDAEAGSSVKPIGSAPATDGDAHEEASPGFAECVFDRLTMLKHRTSALLRRLEREEETPPALLRLHLTEIERDADAVESLLRQELEMPSPEAPTLPAVVEPLRDLISTRD